MGCGSSKSSALTASKKAEADRWQRRKKTGFRDSGLDRHVQNCVKQKKHLRHVNNDPQSKQNRNKKIAEIQHKNKKEEAATANPPVGQQQLTENAIQQQRKKLKHRG